jgi:hypothetical protein
MMLFASLDAQDRKLLLWCMGAVVLIAVLAGFFARNENNDDNPIPSSYLTSRHGARAAFELLESSGYSVERWEQPLGELAARADRGTVLILAEPFSFQPEAASAIEQILQRGGRVLVTGQTGGLLLPGSGAQQPGKMQLAPCRLIAEGLGPLANSGEVWMVPAASWRLANPRHHVAYNCAGDPAVVEFATDAGGHAVWWASSTPLENGSIARAGNLDLFLNSLGERAGHRFYWDESLHGEVHSYWSYARGPALYTLLGGTVLLGLLMVFSFSRRSGPVRDLPLPPRSTPVEFIDALGSLYAKAGAAPTAVAIAWERFRRRMGALCGQNGLRWSAQEAAAALRRRFPQASPELEGDLEACAEAVHDDALPPKKALVLVQALDRHAGLIEAAARAGIATPGAGMEESQKKSRRVG